MAETSPEKGCDSAAYSGLRQGQIDCLQLAALHLTSEEIAAHLGISRHMVDQHIRGALRTLKVQRRSQAVRHLIAAGLIERLGSDDASGAAARAAQLLDRASLPLPSGLNMPNHLTLGWRAFWIVAIAIASSAATLSFIAGVASLDRLLTREDVAEAPER